VARVFVTQRDDVFVGLLFRDDETEQILVVEVAHLLHQLAGVGLGQISVSFGQVQLHPVSERDRLGSLLERKRVGGGLLSASVIGFDGVCRRARGRCLRQRRGPITQQRAMHAQRRR
jgi:hypothetical protein